VPRSGISLQLGFSASVAKLAAFLRIRFCFFSELADFFEDLRSELVVFGLVFCKFMFCGLLVFQTLSNFYWFNLL